MSTEHIDSTLIISAPLELSLELESFYVENDKPGFHEILGLAISVLAGDRTLSKGDYTYARGHALLESSVFEDPLRVALLAGKSHGAERGMLRVALAGAPTTITQEAELRDIDKRLPDGLALWTLPEDQIGVPLGERWFPAGPRVLRPIPVDSPSFEADLLEFRELCNPFFHRILFGEPTEEAERLLRSIPGLGGGEISGGDPWS